LNTATASELDRLPGIGPVLAKEIIAYREANGAFARVEDLMLVPGIGQAKLASLRDLVTVD
jgi:competence protein ComEA